MLRTFITASLFALAASALADNTLTPEEQAQGWKLLFDGKTTAGWRAIGKSEFPAKGWTIQDGTLLHTKGGGGGDIVTAEQFDDFELSWEWKIAKGANSGVKYNLPNPDEGLGCEYQILDDENHPDGKRGGGLHQTAGLYDLIEPGPGRKVNPPGKWNLSRIVVSGNKVEHWLNGAKIVEFELGSDALKGLIAKSKYKTASGFGIKTKSPVLLQDHGDEVAFRNIKIKTPKS